MNEVRYLDSATVFATVSPAEAVTALREALASDFDPGDDIPRTITDITAGNLIFMPSEIDGWVGVKLVGLAVDNGERGLPRIQGQYLLYDSTTLELRTIVDGAALTTLRTPAVSVAAVAPALSRFSAPVRLVVFGAGPQGMGHVDTVRDVIDVADVTFVVRHPEKADPGARERGRVIAAGTAEADEALRGADVVVTATTARAPLFDADLVRPGAIVMACGSHDPHTRELPPELLSRSEVVVEDLGTALRECGDIVLAITDGALNADTLITMKQLSTGEVGVDDDRTLVFKGSGMSWEDLAVAAKLVDAAGLGKE